MARTVKVYRIADDGRHIAAGAFESDLQMKWELHLATAAGGLYIATHRGIQLGVRPCLGCDEASRWALWLDRPKPRRRRSPTPRQPYHSHAAVAAQDRGRACRCRSFERVRATLQRNEHFPDAQKLRTGSNAVAVAE